MNLFPLPTYRTTDISLLGTHASDWLTARPAIEVAIGQASLVLLAYGVSEPTGVARMHFRAQVKWLGDLIDSVSSPPYQVGEGPRHPSRWHRWTSRTHPDLTFVEALRLSLNTVQTEPIRGFGGVPGVETEPG